jgi:hypothetical protein
LSEEALSEYNKRRPVGIKAVEVSSEVDRDDPLMIQICMEMGSRVNGSRLSKIQTRSIPKTYSECYKIVEVDGYERIDIDQYKFLVDSLRLIIENCSISNDDKVNLARVVLTSTTSLSSSSDDNNDTEEEDWNSLVKT